MIGIDFGGTRIKIVGVEGAEIKRSHSIRTQSEDPPTRILDRIAQAVRNLEPQPKSVGFAIPGEVDDQGRCWKLTNVRGFEGVALADELSSLLDCQVVVENDGAAAALAELLFGYGRDHPNFLMLALGTGVGGGLVLDGSLRRGANGFAAEVGHVSIRRSRDAWPCRCGEQGCLEAYAGAAALLQRFAEEGGRAENVLEIAQSARRGEAAGIATFEMLGEALGLGLTSIQNVLDLDAIVFAGGVSDAFDLFEEALRRTLVAHAFAKPLGEVRLLVSRFGTNAGAVGAAHLPAWLNRTRDL